MDDRTRQQITWTIVLALVASLVVVAAYRRGEVNMLLHDISSGTPSQRVAAVGVLVDRQTLPDALEDQPRWVQDLAVEAAAMLGTQDALLQLTQAKNVVDAPVIARIDQYLTSAGEKAIGPLVLVLQDKNAAVRAGAGGPLKAIGAPAVPSLMVLIDVYDDGIRGLVAGTLGGIGEPAVKPLLSILRQQKPGPDQGPAAFRRAKAAATAAFKGMGETAMAPMIGELQRSTDPEMRLAATDILGAVAAGLVNKDPQAASRALPPLLSELSSDSSWAVRRRAAAALGGLGDTALNNGVVPALIASLADPRAEVRAAVATSLGKLDDPTAAGPLVRLLATNRAGATAEIAGALQNIGEPAIAPLTAVLGNPNVEVRLVATRTIAAIGTSASVVPLAGALKDPTPDVRRAAADALRNLADPRVLDQLAAALGDSQAAVYYAARDALARMGPAAAPTLVKALGSSDTRVAYTAQQALAQIGVPAIGPLVQGLRSTDLGTRRWSAVALGRIGEEAVSRTAALLHDGAAPETARAAAADALGASRSAAAVSSLLQSLHGAPALVRVAAVNAIGKIAAPEGTKGLVNALADPDPAVRNEAMAVLEDWRLDDVDEQLTTKLTGQDADAARRAAIVLADHSPAASGELIRAVGIAEQASAAQEEQVRRVIEATVADSSVAAAMRLRAVRALAYVGTTESYDALAPLFEAGPEFAEAAAKSVGRIGQRVAQQTVTPPEEGAEPSQPDQATELLLAAFDEATSDQMRLITGSGLAVMGEQPVRPLIDRLRKESTEKRAWLAAILGAIGKPATDLLLDARGREKDPTLRNWMAVALTLIGDAHAMDLIKQLPKEEQPDPAKVEAARGVFVRLQQLL